VVEVTPNEYSFSSAMKALASAVQWRRALQTLGLAQDRQSCNVMGFSVAMGACVKATQWAEALDIFSQIWWAEESPDTLCYNAVLKACQAGRSWELAVDLLQEMYVTALQPNTYSYIFMLGSLAKATQWEKTLALFSDDPWLRLAADAATYNAAAPAFAQSAQWRAAVHLLGHASAKGIGVERGALDAALRACENCGQWAQVLALQPSLQRLCRPDPEEAALLEMTLDGPGELTEPMANALRFQWLYGYPGVPEGQDQLTHGFFKYFASMQAMTARQLLWLNPSASAVLDPFCGSGTVLIEAALAGKAATGSDASPLAAFVARHHTDVERISLDELRAQARALAPDEKELSWDDLRGRLRGLPEDPVTSALWFCLLVALQRAGDGQDVFALSGSKGFVASLGWGDPPQRLCRPMFLGTVELYGAQLTALRSSMPFPDLVRTGCGDARTLQLSRPVEAVITSPPSPGAYSYAKAARLSQGWLAGAASEDLAEVFGRSEDATRMGSMEIGSLSLMETAPAEFAATWRKQQEEWLQAVWKNLVPEGTVSSEDTESLGSSWSQLSTSDIDDDFPAREVHRIRWLELMYATRSRQDWRKAASAMAKSYWMLQRRARIYEARENQKAVCQMSEKSKTREGERDLAWAEHLHQLKQWEKEVQDELEHLEPLTSILVSEGILANAENLKDDEILLCEWYDQWVTELNEFTPACFMQIVTTLSVEDDQRSLHNFLESLSIDLSMFGANRRMQSLRAVANMGPGPDLSEWDRSMLWDILDGNLGRFRVAFKEGHQMTPMQLQAAELGGDDRFQDRSCGNVFCDAGWCLSRRGVFRISYSITPAVRLLSSSDMDLSRMLKVLLDTGRESQSFTTVLSKSLLDEALERTSLSRAVAWLVHAAYLVIVLFLSIASNTEHKPAKTVQVCFILLSAWTGYSYTMMLGGGIVLYKSMRGGFLAGVVKHATLWNLFVFQAEMFATYFACRSFVVMVYGDNEAAGPLFRQRPQLLSFLVLVRWYHVAIGLVQVERLGRYIVPVVHAVSRPESLSFLLFLLIVVLGSFHAYYAFPVRENTGSGEHVLNNFLKIFQFEILGDVSIRDLEDGPSDSFHYSLIAEFLVLKLAATVVILNVYIGLLGDLYGKSVEQKTQVHNRYLAWHAYRHLSHLGRPSRYHEKPAAPYTVKLMWVTYSREETVS
ncbi:unnamed protein product, partial [Symbiodinium sp. CCMP2456]